MSEHSALLQSLIYTAQRAGGAIMAVYATDFSVRDKADASPVTAADEAAEKIILADLAAIAPDIPVVAEEAVAAGKRASRSRSGFFLVDPLDGTREFISRRDEFTVNVALIEDGQPVLGVVYRAGAARAVLGRCARRQGGAHRRRSGRHHALDGQRHQARAARPRTGSPPWPRVRIARPRPTPSWLTTRSASSARSARRSSSAWWRRARPTSIRASAPPWNGIPPRATRCWPPPVDGVTGLEGEPFIYGKPGFRNGNFIAWGLP